MKDYKYYLTYNINFGGSTSINDAYPSAHGNLRGNNIRVLTKEVNKILANYNAKKGCPFNWWYDICAKGSFNFVKDVHNYTYDV